MGRTGTNGHLLAQARAGEVAAFTELHRRYHRAMRSVARRYVRVDSDVEEVVQDAWEAILRGIERFEGRSRLSTWMFSIVANKARTCAKKAQRTRPMSTWGDEEGPDPLLDRFQANKQWLHPPSPWTRSADAIVQDAQCLEAIAEGLDALPESQRAVIWLRDVQGEPGPAVCELLDLSPGQMRILLHRARIKLRDRLDAMEARP